MIMYLLAEEFAALINLLENPPPPTPEFQRAVTRYKGLIEAYRSNRDDGE